jgi:hypothetical protein
MPMVDGPRNGEDSWRLRGTSRQAAVLVAVTLCGVTIVVACLDRYARTSWDSPLLQDWTLLPQGLSAIGLLYLAKARHSTAFAILGVLIGLVIIEDAFHILNPLADRLARVALWARRWTEIRLGVLNGALIYGFVAIVGLSLLAVSHWHGSPDERPVIRSFTALLLVGGFFGGPVSIVAALESPGRLTFVEELGEAMVFAVMAGYVAGLVATLIERRGRIGRPGFADHDRT